MPVLWAIEEVCPVNAITMTEQYELTSYNRLGMIIEFKREEKASGRPISIE